MIQNSICKQKTILPFSIFTFFLLIFLVTSGGHGDPNDGLIAYLTTENFVLQGTISINIEDSPSTEELGFDVERYYEIRSSLQAWSIWHHKGLNEEPNEKFGEFRDSYKETLDRKNFPGAIYPLLPIVGAPFYVIAQTLNIPPIPFVFLFLNSTIIAVSCVVMFYLGKEIFSSEKVGFVLALIFGITSYLWPYTTTMFARPLAILFLMTFIYLIIYQRKNKNPVIPIFAGLSLGLSFVAHYHFLFVLPIVIIFGIYELRKNLKSVILFIIPIFLLIAAIGFSNYTIRGDFDNFGSLDITGNISYTMDGIYGLLFSPGRSIFLYFPIALLYPFGLYYLYQKDKSLTLFLLVLSIAFFLFVGTGESWYINPYWGPDRYLTPLIPLISIAIGSLIIKFSNVRSWKWGIVSLSSFGFIVNLLGNLVWVQYAYAFGWNQEKLWKVEDPWQVFSWNPFYSPFLQTLKVLITDWVATLPINLEALNYYRIGLNGCSYDLYLFCEYGILSIILIGAILVFNFVIIMKLLNRTTKKQLMSQT